METLELRVGARKFREKIHLNQTALAKKLSVTPANLSKWEAGKGTPSFRQAKKLLEMGMPVEWLFGVEYEKIHNYVKKEEVYSSEELLDIKKRILALEEGTFKYNASSKPK